MAYGNLGRTAIYHLLAGLALSIVFIVVLTLYRYERSLLTHSKRIEAVRMNTIKLSEETTILDALKKKIDVMLPSEYNSKSHRELMLLALDGIKTNIKMSEVKVSNFEEAGGEVSLKANLTIPVNDWNIFLKDLHYLQNLQIRGLPFFDIKSILIKAGGAESSGGLPVCAIEGSFKMPVERLRPL